jgi:hypothetical protein
MSQGSRRPAPAAAWPGRRCCCGLHSMGARGTAWPGAAPEAAQPRICSSWSDRAWAGLAKGGGWAAWPGCVPFSCGRRRRRHCASQAGQGQGRAGQGAAALQHTRVVAQQLPPALPVPQDDARVVAAADENLAGLVEGHGVDAPARWWGAISSRRDLASRWLAGQITHPSWPSSFRCRARRGARCCSAAMRRERRQSLPPPAASRCCNTGSMWNAVLGRARGGRAGCVSSARRVVQHTSKACVVPAALHPSAPHAPQPPPRRRRRCPCWPMPRTTSRPNRRRQRRRPGLSAAPPPAPS